MRRDVIVNFKKLLCTAFLALACCATSASAFNERDIIDAQIVERSINSVHGGETDTTLSASYLYFVALSVHLKEMLSLGFEGYVRSPDFADDVRSVPVLKRHHREGSFNAENFRGIMEEAIRLSDSRAPAYTKIDINCASVKGLLYAFSHGVFSGVSPARKQYYIETRNHLNEVLRLGFEGYSRSPDFADDVLNIPVLKRHYGSGRLNAENFEEIIQKTIKLFDYLIQTEA